MRGSKTMGFHSILLCCINQFAKHDLCPLKLLSISRILSMHVLQSNRNMHIDKSFVINLRAAAELGAGALREHRRNRFNSWMDVFLLFLMFSIDDNEIVFKQLEKELFATD